MEGFQNEVLEVGLHVRLLGTDLALYGFKEIVYIGPSLRDRTVQHTII